MGLCDGRAVCAPIWCARPADVAVRRCPAREGRDGPPAPTGAAGTRLRSSWTTRRTYRCPPVHGAYRGVTTYEKYLAREDLRRWGVQGRGPRLRLPGLLRPSVGGAYRGVTGWVRGLQSLNATPRNERTYRMVYPTRQKAVNDTAIVDLAETQVMSAFTQPWDTAHLTRPSKNSWA